jgi:mRNA interferase MazF
MQKDFQKWHNKKSEVDTIEERPFFHVREIWFCHLGANVGFEQDGNGDDFLRPIIVFRKFNNEILWGIPLTKKGKDTKYYFTFSFSERGENRAILSQIRLIDARRLSYHIGEISEEDFRALIEKLKALLP